MSQGDIWYGVDIQKEDIADNFAACVWEPAVVKINAIIAASEAAAQVLTSNCIIVNDLMKILLQDFFWSFRRSV